MRAKPSNIFPQEIPRGQNNPNVFPQPDLMSEQVNRLALDAKEDLNRDRTFNQLTSKASDACAYKQLLNLMTVPARYHVNSWNNVSSLGPMKPFTAIGNAAVVNVSNLYDRPLPSNLQRTSSVYTSSYNTSPFLAFQGNIGFDTDADLYLKTGMTLRVKGSNKSVDSQAQWPHYGDMHSAELGKLYTDFGQKKYAYRPAATRTSAEMTPGLTDTLSVYERGRDTLLNGYDINVSTRNMMINIAQGPLLSNKEVYPEYLKLNNKGRSPGPRGTAELPDFLV